VSKDATLRLARDPNLLGHSLLYIKELCCDKQIIFVPLGLSLAISMTFVFAISDFLNFRPPGPAPDPKECAGAQDPEKVKFLYSLLEL